MIIKEDKDLVLVGFSKAEFNCLFEILASVSNLILVSTGSHNWLENILKDMKIYYQMTEVENYDKRRKNN